MRNCTLSQQSEGADMHSLLVLKMFMPYGMMDAFLHSEFFWKGPRQVQLLP
jgi:hypothetical protein